MSFALFDPAIIMRAVRAGGGLPPPATVTARREDSPKAEPSYLATTATRLQTAPKRSHVAVVAASADWRERHRELSSSPCPDGLSPDRWTVILGGVESFSRDWAVEAMSLGWSLEDLFALREPFANVSLQGAAWLVGDSTVTAVTAAAVTLRTDGGATQRIYRKPRA